jgi:hypothetical protein
MILVMVTIGETMNDDLNALLEESAGEVDLPNDDEMERLSVLVDKQLELEEAVDELEATLKEKKRELENISTRDIPDIMDEFGFAELKLTNGRKVAINPFYTASIPKERVSEAHQYLIDHEYGDSIKNDVVVHFSGTQRERALNAFEKLQTFEKDVELKTSIHHSTLRAIVRSVYEGGEELPDELFRPFIGRKCRIK